MCDYHLDGHYLRDLYSRQLCADPARLSYAFTQRMYPLNSFVQRLTLERKLEGHEGCVNCINFSPDGGLLASGSDDLKVIMWDWSRGTPVTSFDSGHVANVFQAKFMPYTGNCVLVTAARDGQIICTVLSSSGSMMSTKRVAHHNDSAHKLALEPDSPHVFLSCGEDGGVMEVDLREDPPKRKRILICRSPKNTRIALYSIFIDPSNYNYFAISGREQFARIYDRRMLSEVTDNSSQSCPEPVKKYCPHHLENPENEIRKANITCSVYSHDGKELLCSYNDEDIYIFDTSHSTGSDYVKRYSGHRNNQTVKGVNFFGPQSEYVVSGSDCGHVFIWDKETQKIVHFLRGDSQGAVNCLEPHPYIPILATSGLDHDVKMFSPTAPCPTTLKGLEEIVKKNNEERDEYHNNPIDGYELFMQLIARQYRRGLRRQAGIPDSDSGESGDEEGREDLDEQDDDSDNEEEGQSAGGARGIRCVQS